MVVTFTSRVNFNNDNILSEPTVFKSLYILYGVLLLNIVVFMKIWHTDDLIHTHPNSYQYFIYAIKHRYICIVS